MNSDFFKAILRTLFLFMFGLFLCDLSGQNTTAYWVYFTDKDGEIFNPKDYFHPSALHRRAKHNLPLCDSTDFPVKQDYIDRVCAHVNYCGYPSRWFNSLFVYAEETTAEIVKRLPFVSHVEMVKSKIHISHLGEANATKDSAFSFNRVMAQIDAMNGDLFRQQNLNGSGIRIAVLDAGFTDVDNHDALSHVHNKFRVAETFNFARPKRDVYRSNQHGLMVLSNIAGIFHTNQLLGLAPGATFLLALTEVKREIFKEEQWWLAAAEWADKHGVDIINSSLGYSYERYFPEEMNGRKTLVSKAANMASKKGILVVCSAGNDGDKESWGIISAPADADSVLTVGGVDPYNHFKTSFSSVGPNRRGVMKPNVCAHGNTMVAMKDNNYGYADGTSFSAPLITGFAACLMQAMPNATNMEIKDIIEKSGSLYPYFDYAHGYGIPQAHLALGKHEGDGEPTFKVSTSDAYKFHIFINPDVCKHQRMGNEIFRNHLYISFEDEHGVLLDYYLIEPLTSETGWNYVPEKTHLVRMHYNGYTIVLKYDDKINNDKP